MNDVLILSAARTPIGSFLGSLSSLSASELGAQALKACLERTEFPGYRVDQVLMGNVLQAGQGQAPARQAAHRGRPPEVDRRRHGPQGLRLGDAGGHGRRERASGRASTTSSSRAGWSRCRTPPTSSRRGGPGLPDGARPAPRLDDLTTASGTPTRTSTWATAPSSARRSTRFTREAQDAYALESYQRARRANDSGDFKAEIAPVTIEGKKGTTVVDRDEEPFATPLEKLEKMGSLKPAFQKDGTVTAANSSKINDGAAALVLASRGGGPGDGGAARSPGSSPRPRTPRSRSGSRRRPSLAARKAAREGAGSRSRRSTSSR